MPTSPIVASSSNRGAPPVCSVLPTGSSVRSYTPSAKKRGVKRPSASARAVRRINGRSPNTRICEAWVSVLSSNSPSSAGRAVAPAPGFSGAAVAGARHHAAASTSAGSAAITAGGGAATPAASRVRNWPTRFSRKATVSRSCSAKGLDEQPTSGPAAANAAARWSWRRRRRGRG